MAGENPVFARKRPRSGAVVPKLFFKYFSVFRKSVDLSSARYLSNTYKYTLFYWQLRFLVDTNLSKMRLSTKRLLSIVENHAVTRASELYRSGAHPDQLSTAE